MYLKEISESDNLVIKELDDVGLEQAYPVIQQLRTHLNFEEYVAVVKEMRQRGYQIFCLFEGEKVVTYAGFVQAINMYYGNHLWVYDLVTDEKARGKGYGQLLLSHLEAYGKDKGLERIALSSRFHMKPAHQFYEESCDYEKIGYVFLKDL